MTTVLDADTGASGGRGSPNAWSPSSNSTNWAKIAGSAPTISQVSSMLHATGVSTAFVYELGSGTATDAEALIRFKCSSTSDVFAAFLRETATNNYYYAQASLATQNLKINKNIAGTLTQIGSSFSFTMSAATLYWIRFRVVGTNLYGRIWADGNSEPSTWGITTTDSAISTAGGWGVRAAPAASGDTVDFDSYQVFKVFSCTCETQAKFYTQFTGLKSKIVAQYYTQFTGLTARAVERFYTRMANLKAETVARFYTRTALKSEAIAKFYTRTALKTETVAKFYTAMSLRARTQAKFYTRMSGLKTKTVGKFYTRTALKTETVAKFITAKALLARTVARFLVHVVPPRVLLVAFGLAIQHINAILSTPVQHINAILSTPVQHINATFSEVAMTTPYTTVDVSATVKDGNGSLVSNLTTYTLAISYQDGTTAAPTVTNMGSGVYTATYNTKGVGVLTELWNFVDVSGAIAEEQRTYYVSF